MSGGGPVSVDVQAAWPTNEALRILVAIRDKTLTMNSAGRYVIEGQERPDRATREKLRSRGLIENWWVAGSGHEWRLTDKGRAALAEVGL